LHVLTGSCLKPRRKISCKTNHNLHSDPVWWWTRPPLAPLLAKLQWMMGASAEAWWRPILCAQISNTKRQLDFHASGSRMWFPVLIRLGNRFFYITIRK
jgi:hypothetical protein